MPPTPRPADRSAARLEHPLGRPESRLAALALMTGVLAVLVFTCYVGGTATESRIEGTALGALEDTAEPPTYRTEGPVVLVCTADAEAFAERNEQVGYNRRIENERAYEDCLADGRRDLASALADAEPGDRIQVLPGYYPVEEPLTVTTADLQIEGRGDTPDDVQLSARFGADTVLTADGADGLYLTGLSFAQSLDAALRVIGTEGAAIAGVGAIQSAGDGIHVADSSGVAVTGCTARAADGAGIRIERSGAAVDGCEATANTVGIELDGIDTTASVTGNRLHANTTGLVIADTGVRSAVTASGNLVYGNNADHYGALGTGACTREPAERLWADGVLCPDRTFPSGVGVLVADGTGVAVTGNRLWNQQTAAVAAWGTPGQDSGSGGDLNTFADNTFGIREDNQRLRNRLDVWWDGTGVGNCFDEPGVFRSAPSVLPACGSDVARVAGDPLRTLKAWQCGIGPAAEAPAHCDWLGAQFTERIEFQVAVLAAAALLFLTGAGWLAAARAPSPPRAGQMTFSAIATGFGGLLFVLAVWSSRADYEALAVGLWGLGWLLAGRSWYRCGMRFLGPFTGIVGALAVLDAIDRGVATLAPMPVSPAWLWLGLLPLWTLVAVASAFGPHRREPEPVPVERTPVTAPANDRWDW